VNCKINSVNSDNVTTAGYSGLEGTYIVNDWPNYKQSNSEQILVGRTVSKLIHTTTKRMAVNS
jgi:hypothetical protein